MMKKMKKEHRPWKLMLGGARHAQSSPTSVEATEIVPSLEEPLTTRDLTPRRHPSRWWSSCVQFLQIHEKACWVVVVVVFVVVWFWLFLLSCDGDHGDDGDHGGTLPGISALHVRTFFAICYNCAAPSLHMRKTIFETLLWARDSALKSCPCRYNQNSCRCGQQ